MAPKPHHPNTIKPFNTNAGIPENQGSTGIAAWVIRKLLPWTTRMHAKGHDDMDYDLTRDQRAFRIAALELELGIGDTTPADVEQAKWRATFTTPHDADPPVFFRKTPELHADFSASLPVVRRPPGA